jgi:hypothetical protein
MKKVLNVFVALLMTTVLMGAIYKEDWYKVQDARHGGV